MSLLARITLVTASVAFALAALELASRTMRLGPAGLVNWPNLVRERTSVAEDGPGSCGFAYDPEIGWTAPANCTSPGYNVDAEGLRKTSARSFVAERPVLVTGSSFAMGSEVKDEEAWPAQLQVMLGLRVANGGVGGYSLDQTVLRTEKLVKTLKPLVVVASFTPDDIRRTELKVAWSRPKSFFEIADGRLELRNVPVPGGVDAAVRMPTASRLLGWSALAELVADRLSIFDGWYYDEVQASPRGSGATVACLLMQRLAALGVPVVVMAEYPRSHWLSSAEDNKAAIAKTGAVLSCATKAGLIAFDTSGPLSPAVEKLGIGTMFGSEHQSPEGNRATATAVMYELVRRRLLPTGDRKT